MGWPESIGITGRLPSEWVADFVRNGWPRSIGIDGRNHPEYAKEAEADETVKEEPELQEQHLTFQ